MYIQFSSFTSLYTHKYFFAPIFSPLDCFCTSLHIVLIIWHTALYSFPYLLNQMYSIPVLCSSSLQDFPSAIQNVLIVDCNNDSQSAVVMSTFYPTKNCTHNLWLCFYFWIKSTSTWSFTFTSICIYVAMTCIQTLKFMYEIQVLLGSAVSYYDLPGYDTA